MSEEENKLSIAESLYGSSEDETPKTDSELTPEAEVKKEETPDKEGHVEDEAKPPSKEEAEKVEDQSNLDWMDKEPEPSHSNDGEAKKSEDQSNKGDHKVDYNGRKITASELQQEVKNLESGYTTKMMAVAEKQKSLDTHLSAVDTQKADLATSLTEVENFLKSVVEQEPDWEQLKETLDTEDLVLKRMEYADQKENLKKISVQREILANDQMKKKVNEQVGILTDNYFPEWKDEKKCEDHIRSVFSGAEKFYDYKTDESKHIMLDNRLFRVMADAVNWRKHKATQKVLAEKRSADIPPITAKSNGGKLDVKPKKEKQTMAESLYPQYDTKEPAGV